eukprot:CAMPEP_0204517554 /NCGR_PEP_ID=MMETSP0661-20131031/3730_1 /ASSEMBLY_ACC=CAM_ASM_000606 /TAXON_ID=109239 /ORGANISM="Alexandrium margalefi, Strain AMGDE01CS-322" /LENGTH=226 /DNA_ID=CAMNT_0051522957 /DNA_START=57 /DNA_END=734 /DNA_ORIENTATION=+
MPTSPPRQWHIRWVRRKASVRRAALLPEQVDHGHGHLNFGQNSCKAPSLPVLDDDGHLTYPREKDCLFAAERCQVRPPRLPEEGLHFNGPTIGWSNVEEGSMVGANEMLRLFSGNEVDDCVTHDSVRPQVEGGKEVVVPDLRWPCPQELLLAVRPRKVTDNQENLTLGYAPGPPVMVPKLDRGALGPRRASIRGVEAATLGTRRTSIRGVEAATLGPRRASIRGVE